MPRHPAADVLNFAAGVLVGAVLRPVLMGCIPSAPEEPKRAPAAPAAAKRAPAAQARATAPTPSAVPRAKVVLTERDRAELKLKNQRDKLDASVKHSEETLRADARLALALRDEGKTESCKVVLRRRALVRGRIANAARKLATIEEMVFAMDEAADTQDVLRSIEGGNAALRALEESLSVERAAAVLGESRERMAYVRALAAVVDGTTEPALSEAEFAAAVGELEALAGGEAGAAAAVAVGKVLGVAPAPHEVPQGGGGAQGVAADVSEGSEERERDGRAGLLAA